MISPINPGLRIRNFEVGAKEYRVAFSFNAIAEAEAVTKLNILTGVLNLSDASALQVRGMLYASLQPEAGKRFTLEECGQIIQEAMAEQKYCVLVSAIISSLSDVRPPVEELPDPNRASAQS